jgi:hypothetical protein
MRTAQLAAAGLRSRRQMEARDARLREQAARRVKSRVLEKQMMDEFKQQLLRRGGLARPANGGGAGQASSDDGGGQARREPQSQLVPEVEQKQSSEHQVQGRSDAADDMLETPTAAATSPDAAVDLREESSFDAILREWLGRERGQVSAKVVSHTEAVWGVSKDLQGARRRLIEDAAKLVVSGLAASTRASYSSACRTYEHFCKAFGFVAYELSDEQLTLFVAFSVKRVKVASVEQYLKAVREACESMGMKPPSLTSFPRLQRALQGARYSERADRGDGYYRLPITLQMLAAMVEVALKRMNREREAGKVVPVGGGLEDGVQRATMYVVAFFGAMRPGEITLRTQRSNNQPSVQLRMKHIRRMDVVNPYTMKRMGMWSLFLESSKTDQLGERSDIALGESGQDLCPVRLLDFYMQARRQQGHNLDDGETLVFPAKNGLTSVKYDDFLVAVRQDLNEAGYDTSKYAGHSFRIGCATTLAVNGVPDHLIQAVGRWESDCYKRYIRIEPERRAMLAAFLHGQAGAWPN